MLSYGDDYNQVAVARDVVSYSRMVDREMESQPPKVWYDSLRGNAKSSSMSTDRVMLSVNSKIKRTIENATTGDMTPGTFSIPIRKAQHEFIARGQSALLGYRSKHRDLGIAKPTFEQNSASLSY